MAKRVTWDEDEIAKRVELGSFSSIVVDQYERALLVKEGEVKNVFKAGEHSVTNFEILNNPFAVYVSLQNFKLKVGIGDVMSEDNVEVGCYGTIELAVDDAEMFYAEVLGDKDRYTTEEVKKYIESDIQGFLRSEIAEYEAKELYKKNDVFVPKLRSKLSNFFTNMGLDFKNITIQGINLPEEIKEALQSKKTQEIELDKEEKRMEMENKKKQKENERMIEKYQKLKEAGIDVSEFKEKEIAENDPEVLIEKYKADQEDDAEEEDASDKGYCTECGEKLEPGARYCHNCGAEVPET